MRQASRASAVALVLLCTSCVHAARDDTPSAELIVAWKSAQPAMSVRLREVEQTLGARVQHVREMSGNAHLLLVLDELDAATLDAALARLNDLPDIRYAERNQRRVMH